jgi:nucleoid-associated protein YgaU
MPYLLYTIQPEDRVRGLDGLARWLYGAPERWIELYHANHDVIGDDPIALWPGQQLIVPYDLVANPLQVRLYQVQGDDCRHGLAGIALRHFDDPRRAEQIYLINQGVIGANPDQLQTGQMLILPQVG